MIQFQYGARSAKNLESCHPILQRVADEVLMVTPYDISIIHGWRGLAEQNALFDKGASRKKFPHSRHNKTNDPHFSERDRMSDAIDFAPYVNGGINWGDTHIFAVVAGCFIAVAAGMGYKLRWGGDWDSDGMTTDQTLMDWGHIEIKWPY